MRFRFIHWSDGSDENPRTISVAGDETMTAIYTPVPERPSLWLFPLIALGSMMIYISYILRVRKR